MSSGPRTPGPRHLAGGAHRAGAPRSSRPPAVEAALEPTEVAPVARVPRHRFAFALAVTVAALPILVLDNLPATAASAEKVEKVSSAEVAAQANLATTSTTPIPTTTAPPVALAAVAPPLPSTTTTTTAAAPSRTAVATLRTTPTTTPTTQAPAPTTTTTSPPAPATTTNGDPNDPASWDRMAQCEAGGNWAANTGNGYYGGLQFSLGTWHSYGGTGYPHEASRATQIAIGKKLQAAKGWSAWPGCARRLGFT